MTQDLPKDQKYKGDSKGYHSEDFGWDAITTNIGSNNINIFEISGKSIIQEC